MKKIIFGAALLLSCFMLKTADAQLKINFNLNIGSQPDWGPTGYDHVEYYYLPDIDAYYYVPGHYYVYQQGNAWIHATTLPARYSNYNLYSGYKVVVNQANPWNNQAAIRAKYARYKGHRGQTAIRDSHDKKYQNHWNSNNNNRPGNDHGRSGNNDHGHGHDDHGGRH